MSAFFIHNGVLFPTAQYSAESLTYLENEFRFLDDDVLSVSYPKSGGHWMAEIFSVIQQEWNPSGGCREKIPWIETFDGLKAALKYPPPRILASHLPINLFPKTFLESKAKVVYTLRNPKDVLILFYNSYKKWKDPGTLDEFLEEFLTGNVSHGSWFDHVKGWMQMKKRENFFFITVEQLKQDLRGSVERICQFLGKELSSQQIDAVVENPCFKKVKNETLPITSRRRTSISTHIKLLTEPVLAAFSLSDEVIHSCANLLRKLRAHLDFHFLYSFAVVDGDLSASAMTYFKYKGIMFPTLGYSVETLGNMDNEFQLFDGDILTAAYPKSGINWMQEILGLIRHNGDPSWVQTVPLLERSHWIETDCGLKSALGCPPPRHLVTHLPFQLVPKSLLHPKVKVICVLRDPRDVLVSLYHFSKFFNGYPDPENMEDFMEKFLTGNVAYGSWFDHVKSWMEMKDRSNFFFITYEELQEEFQGSVERICQFLGKELNSQQIESVVENASFQKMKDNKMSNFHLTPEGSFDHKKGKFMRKGISGDWKNHLTVAQSKYFDHVYEEQMRGVSITFSQV